MAETVITNRDYIDNFSVKEYTEDDLIPKFFPDIDTNLRTVGLVGYVSEILTNIGEDAFNTASVMFRESFPNRAQIDESIYSHAAIFQLDDVFSTAASCRFLLVMNEEAIIKNMQAYYDQDTGIYHFYIDKNTQILVENKSFVLDYTIGMNIVKKISETGTDYIFTAYYILDEMRNVLSNIINPYVKVRRSSDGYIALEVATHQCYRLVEEFTILDNSSINLPKLDVTFTGKLAGFDVMYYDPDDETWTQMQTLIVYSQPLKTEFCYYQMLSEGVLRITFNTKDNYFMPAFNSTIRVILYITEGSEGNFDIYEGSNIMLVPDTEIYQYSNTYLTAAKPIGASEGGQDQRDMDSLQALTVEGYRTATALTTDNDLQEYFNNYKYRYGNAILKFIKRRDDVYERVYSAFIIMQNQSYIYKTNTLKLALNVDDMRQTETNLYLLDPGYLFTANEADGYAKFYVDKEKHDQYYSDYLEAVANNEIYYIPEEEWDENTPIYLKRAASFATFKARNSLEDKLTVFDLDESEMAELSDPIHNKFLLMNPFLIQFRKSPNLISTYMTYVVNNTLLDFIDVNDDSYVQFIAYTFKLHRGFEKKKRYSIRMVVTPSIAIDLEYPIIPYDKETEKYIFDGKYAIEKNDIRVVMVISSERNNICFAELVPTEYDEASNGFIFETTIYTDDHISSDSKLRLLENIIYRYDDGTGYYYKAHDDDATLYDEYDANDNVIATDIPVDTITELYNSGVVRKWQDVYNMSMSNDVMIPMENVECKIYTLYNRIYNEATGALEKIDASQTNNIFYDIDKKLVGYLWTNIYSTVTEPITFMKPLNSVRTYLQFEDCTTNYTDEETGEVKYYHDIMDTQMWNISFLKADMIFKEELLDYFMDSFLSHYEFLEDIIKNDLRNETNIDVKLYNTYGRSLNFIIGEDEEPLNTLNLRIELDMWFAAGTDLVDAIPKVKNYIKNEIEHINSYGTNSLYISNLMRKLEINFAYIDHIRFVSINEYDTDYQAVRTRVDDLSDLTTYERRFYVPEFLVCDTENIIINEYFTSTT